MDLRLKFIARGWYSIAYAAVKFELRRSLKKCSEFKKMLLIFQEYETKKNLSMKVIAGSKTKEFVIQHRK